MKKLLKTSTRAMMLTASLVLTAALPASAQSGACLDQIAIRQAVQSGQILPLAGVLNASGNGQAQVLNAQVCQAGASLVYYLSILDPSGQARNIALNAVNGSPYTGG